jgi:uncharacterized damage-inducible protein DinB
MIPAKLRNYTMISLEGTPIVMQGLLGRFAADDPIWDKRPQPERFTLREVLAHLADWDEIFLERIMRTASEDNPTLPDRDEGQLAIDHGYTRQDPLENIQRFAQNRAALTSYVKSLPESAFDRVALRPELGSMSIALQLALIQAHDGYHTRQAAEYIETISAV